MLIKMKEIGMMYQIKNIPGLPIENWIE